MEWHSIWVADWNRLWYRLWSVRFNIAGGALEVGDFVFALYANTNPHLWVQGVSVLLHFAAPIARGIPQWKAKDIAKAANESAKSNA